MTSRHYADLLLTNARVITMESGPSEEPGNSSELGSPTAGFVVVRGDRILGVGDHKEADRFKGAETKEMDCQGMALLPGFHDAHCHLLALASSLKGVDCRPDVAPSISSMVEAISSRAHTEPAGTWIRAFGYDEFYLAEKAHPTRWDLDSAAPDHLIRLDHRTGHASVLNSRALLELGISRHTSDPVQGVIERDDTGEPTGALYEMNDYIRRAMPHRQNDADLPQAVARANALLLSKGITSLQDASPSNDLARWQTFLGLKEEGHLIPRATVMMGAARSDAFLEAGLTPGQCEPRIGAVKVMLTLTTGALNPSAEELRATVLKAHAKGLQVAIHAVEEEAVRAAAEALELAQQALPRPDARHHIEHCSECPPDMVEAVRRCGAMVVTQPSFIHENGEKYLALTPEAALPHLYPTADLGGAGVVVAAGSDAPVALPDPLLGIYAAVTRRARNGTTVGLNQAIGVESALRMHTVNGAYACFDEHRTGSLAVGKMADMVLLDHDPTAVEPEAIKDIQVMMTMVGGKVVWER